MRMRLFQSVPRRIAAVPLLAAGLLASAGPPVQPAPLSNAEFWSLVVDLSEPGGTFGADNLVSNERAYQHVVPGLAALPPSGAYVGVGPDQNFTYILALRPRIAFVVDIRRDNLRLHLLYKALVELASDRADFLARLFARPRPAEADAARSAEALFEAFARVEPSDAYFRASADQVATHLAAHRGAPLSVEDRAHVQRMHHAFVRAGPAMTYASSPAVEDRRLPSFAELQQASDLDGHRHGYLASEAAFARLREWQRANLIVPVVGDFAGPRALRAIGAYLGRRRIDLVAFYASNVEAYLFGDGRWRAFYGNLEALPRSPASLLIRSTPGSSRLDPILPLLEDVRGGRIRTYADITGRAGIR